MSALLMRTAALEEIRCARVTSDARRLCYWQDVLAKLDAEDASFASLDAKAGGFALPPRWQGRTAALRAGAWPVSTSSVTVDRSGYGTLRGVAVASTGEAIGHGFELDGASLDQVASLLSGKPGRWTHGPLFGDALGQHLGRWSAPRREGDVVRADFGFAEAAHKIAPDGIKTNAADYLMGRAQEDPSSLGVSAVIGFAIEETRMAEVTRRFARVKTLERADFVSDPAVNPRGLLGR